MFKNFIGRKKEKNVVFDYLAKKENSPTATLIGVNGARRVGKTTFIENIIQEQQNSKEVFVFQFIGLQSANNKKNIDLCRYKLESYIYENSLFSQVEKDFFIKLCSKIKDWNNFFDLLGKVFNKIKNYDNKSTIILFLDEICWFSKKDNFVFSFKYFWNLELSKINKLICFIAGSKISWMKDQLFEDKKEFLNRIDLTIELKPFSIIEISKYLKLSLKQIDLSEEDIIKYYSIFGGIIKYYQLIDFNKNFKENFESFLKDKTKVHFILNEKEMLFDSIFSEKRLHKEIIQCLSYSKSLDINKLEIKLKELLSINSSNKENIKINRASLYRDLEELILNGIIETNNKSKFNLYFINHNFSYFYFYWFEKNPLKNKKTPLLQVKKDIFSFEDANYDQWKGSSFEILVFNQLETILKQHKWIENKIINSKNLNLNTEIENDKKQLDLMINYDFDKFLVIETKNYNNEWIISSNEFLDFNQKRNSLNERYAKFLIISLNESKFNKNISFDNENINNFDILVLSKWLKDVIE